MHLPSSTSTVVSSIVAGKQFQALPVEPDSQVDQGPRLTGSGYKKKNEIPSDHEEMVY